MRVLRSLSAAAGIALLVSGSAGADTPVAITYVPKSLAEASGWPLDLAPECGQKCPRRFRHCSVDPDTLSTAHYEIWYALRELLRKRPGANCSGTKPDAALLLSVCAAE
jgi:hypothetical protein